MENRKTLINTKKYNKRSRDFINEIKSHDIYTINNSEVYNCLPGVSDSYCGGVDSPTLLLDCDPYLNKSNLRCRSSMKKLSLQNMKKSFVNLPALVEEENNGGHAVPTPGSHDLTLADKMDNNTCKNKKKDDESAETEDLNEDSSLEMLNEDDFDDDESWVDLSKHTQPAASSSPNMSHTQPPKSPERTTPPPFGNGEEYLRLLREAQKESNQSSARVSLASSRRDTPRDSPKSPPNSPNTELVLEAEEPRTLEGVYINYYNRDGDFIRVEKNVETDWIWDWSSRPDQTPPKEWKFIHPGGKTRRGASIRRLMVGNSSLFSRDVLYTLIITNVLSLLLGTGIGLWLSRRSGGGGSGGTMPLTMIPIN